MLMFDVLDLNRKVSLREEKGSHCDILTVSGRVFRRFPFLIDIRKKRFSSKNLVFESVHLKSSAKCILKTQS